MPAFVYSNGHLCAEDVALADVVKQFGTPVYVYSRAAMESQWRAFDQAFKNHNHLICYAVKANSNIAILNILARLGSGFDIVSAGELARVIKAGGDPGKVVFSGVGKTSEEMEYALKAGIKCFNVESIAELERLNAIAGDLKNIAPVSLRVNPDVDVDTHPYIATGLKENKFGIPFEEAEAVYQHAADMPHINVIGIDCHIGSQITVLSPIIDALGRLKELVGKLQKNGIEIRHIDIGGGLGIHYRNESPPTVDDYGKAVAKVFSGNSCEIILEPGRSILGKAGALLTRVEYIKKTPFKNFAIVDAAMNDLLRPALYDAWHEILPLDEQSRDENPGSSNIYDIVGPVCETGDFLGKERKLSIQEGSLLAVCSAGAYGFCMSSNYNSRPRVAEIMIDRDKIYEIRERETREDLMAGERLLPE